MKQQWVGAAIVVVWLGQLAFLWPLPSDMASEILAKTPEMKSFIANYEQTLWLGWISRVFLVTFGVVAGVAAIRENSKWPIIYLLSALAYLVVFRPWKWITLLALGLWKRPELLFNTVFFPVFIIAVGAYTAFQFAIVKKAACGLTTRWSGP